MSFAGTNYWGGYGRYVNVPDGDRNVIHLPERVDYDTAASLGCRFMTAFQGVLDQAAVRSGEWVSVHGCGGLGLSTIHIAAATGANVAAVDISPEALDLARSLGAVATVNPLDGDTVEQVREIIDGGAHVAVDALGIAATCQAAAGGLRKRGRLLQMGLTSQDEGGMIPLPIDSIVLREQTVVGTANMPVGRFPDMMRMVERENLRPDKLITRRIGLDQASEAVMGMGAFKGAGVTVLNRW